MSEKSSIRKFTKIYPYEPSGVGTPIAEFLAGKAKLGRVTSPPRSPTSGAPRRWIR